MSVSSVVKNSCKFEKLWGQAFICLSLVEFRVVSCLYISFSFFNREDSRRGAKKNVEILWGKGKILSLFCLLCYI
jgi:hypothetical protein